MLIFSNNNYLDTSFSKQCDVLLLRVGKLSTKILTQTDKLDISASVLNTYFTLDEPLQRLLQGQDFSGISKCIEDDRSKSGKYKSFFQKPPNYYLHKVTPVPKMETVTPKYIGFVFCQVNKVPHPVYLNDLTSLPHESITRDVRDIDLNSLYDGLFGIKFECLAARRNKKEGFRPINIVCSDKLIRDVVSGVIVESVLISLFNSFQLANLTICSGKESFLDLSDGVPF